MAPFPMPCDLDIARDFPDRQSAAKALGLAFASLPGRWAVTLREATFVHGAWSLTVSASDGGPMASALLEAQTDSEEVCTLATWLVASLTKPT